MSEPNYRCVHVACICPKCHEEITLKVYTQILDNRTKQPTLWVELADFCGEEEKC